MGREIDEEIDDNDGERDGCGGVNFEISALSITGLDLFSDRFSSRFKQDAPKGKRKLEFKEKKSEKTRLPLAEKIILVDLKDGPQKKKIEADLKILGARVDTFLSKDIHYLITGQPRPVSSRDDHHGQSPASPADVNTPSPFNCGPSPSPTVGGGKQAPPETVPRGKAIAQRAKSSRQLGVTEDLSQLVVRNAEKFGVKIVALDSALKWIQRELAKLPASLLKGPDNQKGRNHVRLKKLKSPFIKFEAASLQYKAIQQHLEVWPRANTDTPRGTCPFDGNGMRRGDRSREDRGERIGLIPLEPVLSDTPSKESKTTTPDSKSKSGKKRHSTSIVGGVRIVTAGEIRRQKEQRRIQDRRRGYCECCEDKYEDLYKHVRDEKHKAFVRDKKNYEKLDVLIRTGPDVASFIQRVLMNHCSKKSTTGKDSMAKEKDIAELPGESGIREKSSTVLNGSLRRKVSLRKESPRKTSKHSPRKVSLKGHISTTKSPLSNKETVNDSKTGPCDSNQESVENTRRRSPRKSPRKSPFISKCKNEQDGGHSLESHFFPARTRNFIVVHHKSPKDDKSLGTKAVKATKDLTLSKKAIVENNVSGENEDKAKISPQSTEHIPNTCSHSQGIDKSAVHKEDHIEEQFLTEQTIEEMSPVVQESDACSNLINEQVQDKEPSIDLDTVINDSEETSQISDNKNLQIGAIDSQKSKDGATVDSAGNVNFSPTSTCRRTSLRRGNKSGVHTSKADSPSQVSTQTQKVSKNSSIIDMSQEDEVDGDVVMPAKTVVENDVSVNISNAENTNSLEGMSHDATNKMEGSRRLRSRLSRSCEKSQSRNTSTFSNEVDDGEEKVRHAREVAIRNGNQVLSSPLRAKMSVVTNKCRNEPRSTKIKSVVVVEESSNKIQTLAETFQAEHTQSKESENKVEVESSAVELAEDADSCKHGNRDQIDEETSPGDIAKSKEPDDNSVISPSHYQEHLLVASDFVDKIHRLRATNRRNQIVDEKVKIISEGSPVVASPMHRTQNNVSFQKSESEKIQKEVSSISLDITSEAQRRKCLKKIKQSVPGSPKFNKSPAFKAKMKKKSRNLHDIRNPRRSVLCSKNDIELISDSSSPTKEGNSDSEKLPDNSSQKPKIRVPEKGKVARVKALSRKRLLSAVQKSPESKVPRRSLRSATENSLCTNSGDADNNKEEKDGGRGNQFMGQCINTTVKILQEDEHSSTNLQEGLRKSARNRQMGRGQNSLDSGIVHQGLEESNKDSASCSTSVLRESTYSVSNVATSNDGKFVAIKKIDPSTPILKGRPTFAESEKRTSLLSSEIKSPSKSPRQRRKTVNKNSASPFSLTWRNAKGYTPKSKRKRVSLNKSWNLLSNRSIVKLFENDKDEEVFEGFEPTELNEEKAVVSEASYVETTEVEFENDSDREWYVEEEEDENNLSAYVPNILSSPGFKSDSSWGEACADFINSKANSSLLRASSPRRSSPRRSPLKMVRNLMKSPTGKCKSHVTSASGHKKCEKRKRLQSQENDDAVLDEKNSFTPKRKKLSRSQSVTFAMKNGVDKGSEEDGVEKVDDDIVFNYMSPQKLKHKCDESDEEIMGISSSPLEETTVLKTSTPHARVERRSSRSKKALNLSNVSVSNEDPTSSAIGSHSFPMLEHRNENRQENDAVTRCSEKGEDKSAKSNENVSSRVQRRSGRLHRS
ncbi:hypothetical protein FSP39_013881 [Pinctada imbricata]|uniref:DBF4-type domain-containing protein n=1 Tax=Pinctada imbricata TaxID=66713 RepID=A0AA89C7K2_PINIB|nr:hypothetical protein FSP39_013881 [Pinctada imbricata]